jgi:hypothetical protein
MITINIAALIAAMIPIVGILVLLLGAFVAGFYIGRNEGRSGL